MSWTRTPPAPTRENEGKHFWAILRFANGPGDSMSRSVVSVLRMGDEYELWMDDRPLGSSAMHGGSNQADEYLYWDEPIWNPPEPYWDPKMATYMARQKEKDHDRD